MADTAKDPAVAVRAIEQVVGRTEAQRGINGAALGLLLRAEVADFNPKDFGVTSLRQFVARHVPKVVIVSFGGAGPIYGMRAWPGVSREIGEGEEASLWRCWVSPLGPLAIAVDRTTGAPTTLPRSAVPSFDKLKVEPAPVAAHQQMARDFLAQEKDLEPTARAQLEAATHGSDGAWWTAWRHILQTQAQTSYGRWRTYRDQALRSLLRASLTNGLSQAAATVAFDQIIEHRRPAARAALGGAALGASVVAGTVKEHAPAGLRATVLAVVAHMSEQELKALSLPVGLVLDQLSTNRDK